MSSREELEKRAQDMLSEAHRLITEAGKLAKEGQFYLHFGEIGEFVPTNLEQTYRDQALELLKKEGRDNGDDKHVNHELTKQRGYTVYDYVKRPPTPFEELTPDEVEVAVDSIASDWAADEVGHDALHYADRDMWWHPSRC